ncbi:class I SAM-dependent methyltransferase [bacterium]|nr:class I SAM-dependent methyltransferase [bacterium]
MENQCPLCNSKSTIFYQYKKNLYHQCNNCLGIFPDKSLVLDSESEKARYKEHNNDVEDKNYQKFVFPITASILRDFTQKHVGLDFGAGTGPVISKVLEDNGFNIRKYDPFFHDYPELLKNKYDYIACCEVMEHFHDPKKEFCLLKQLLKPNGKLYCMTDIYDKSIDFHKWYYRNDATHIFIYHRNTIHCIKKEIGFSNVSIDGRLVTFFN